MIINGLHNVFLDAASNYKFEQLDESLFIEEVMISLSKLLKEEFDEYLFFILAFDQPRIIPSSSKHESKKKKILIFISDESGTVPNYLSPYYHAIFKTHLNTNKILLKNVFHFPLGCVKDVPQLPIIPMADRKYSVFFSGNLNNRRIKLYFSLLSKLTSGGRNFLIRLSVLKKLIVRLKSNFDDRFPNAYIRFTNGFKKGITPLEYGHIMSNSKIVLCPAGFISAECFRHYEAMRAGCVIISEKLPASYFYQDSPILEVDNWKEGLRKVSELLLNHDEIVRLGHLTQIWWNEKCSEEATVQFIYSRIHQIQVKAIV